MGADTTADWSRGLDPARPVLVTGAAGFVGRVVADRLLAAGLPVVGLDNLNDYYDPTLKRERLATLEGRPGFRFVKADLADRAAMAAVFAEGRFETVVHLAAQAGVRYSIENPHAYADSNLTGFLNVLEGCRHVGARHLVYASSSSVYGGNRKLPFATGDGVDHPVSLYAATKKANELMAHTYSHLYGLPTTGLRFFTVYGPMGRPDMAYFKFAEAIAAGRPITVFNDGDMSRDFTYVDDVVDSLLRLLPLPPSADPAADGETHPARSWAPYRVFNIGAKRPEHLMTMIGTLERLMGREAEKRFLPMQPGDVQSTSADVADLEALVGARETTPLEEGLSRFVAWFRGWRRPARPVDLTDAAGGRPAPDGRVQ
jgi:UDP-glucuronate 4-epimerase